MKKLVWPCYTTLFFLLFSLLFYISASQKQQQVNNLKIVQIEKQIALDLPFLDLANDLLKHSGNKAAVVNYIQTLNTFIANSGIQVTAIEPQHEFNSTLQPSEIIHTLSGSHGPVLVVFNVQQAYFTVPVVVFHVVLFILCVTLTYLIKQAYINHSDKQWALNANSQNLAPEPLLVTIDLSNKTLFSSYQPQKKVALANKPLCFYLALVEYCTDHPDTTLSHNKDVPEALIALSNKYFHRLIELGHTIRKRPNFNNSLEKTLSEIRAALDDMLGELPEQKELYYPPKAFGEGSRSRLHSYALSNINKGQLEIIGK